MSLYGKRTHENTSYLLHHGALLRDVDTIQKLADVLLLDQADLVDASSSQGHVLNAVALKDDLVLDIAGADHLDSFQSIDHTHHLLTQEVTDFHLLVINNSHVDREVSIHEPHLVAVTLHHASEQVLDVGADGADGGTLLGLRGPLLDLDLVGANLVDVALDVLEILG